MSNQVRILHSTFLCIVLAVQAFGETGEIRLQQGALRKDGSVVDAAYATKAVTLRGGTAADTVQTSTSMYIGDHNSNPPMRGLFSFDLSYIKTLAGGNPYTINSVTFILTTVTRNTNFVGSTTMSAHLTDAFADESVATYNNPGAGHAAGGNIGTEISTATLNATIAGTAGQTLSFTGAGWITAVSNALSGADNTLNFLVKRLTEDGGANYFFRPADDEYSGALGIAVRPELVIELTYNPRKLSLVVIH
jgi:hypothetical protein